MANAPELIFWLAAFKIIFGFTLLIGIHEFGHAICAWLCGVRVHKFSIGFGPGITFKNVPLVNTLIISPLVFGGFVQMDDESLEGKSFLKRILVYSGGMLANVLLAIVLLVILGVNLWKAITAMFTIWIVGIPMVAQMIFSGAIKATDAVSGPVGISKMMIGHEFPYLFVLALISVSLASFNLIPILPLDGGHILRVCLEKVIGKKWAGRISTALLYIGIPLLLALAAFTILNDISHLVHQAK